MLREASRLNKGHWLLVQDTHRAPRAGGDAEEPGVAWLPARSYQRGEHSEPRLLAPTLKSEPAGILSLAAEKAAGTGPTGTGPLDRPSTGQE